LSRFTLAVSVCLCATIGLPQSSKAALTGVAHIVDGDTITINGTRIRLEGIDAPETDQICLDGKGKQWTCGISARDR
jgi:endonuclease YncB( thermonuclease family)